MVIRFTSPSEYSSGSRSNLASHTPTVADDRTSRSATTTSSNEPELHTQGNDQIIMPERTAISLGAERRIDAAKINAVAAAILLQRKGNQTDVKKHRALGSGAANLLHVSLSQESFQDLVGPFAIPQGELSEQGQLDLLVGTVAEFHGQLSAEQYQEIKSMEIKPGGMSCTQIAGYFGNASLLSAREKAAEDEAEIRYWINLALFGFLFCIAWLALLYALCVYKTDWSRLGFYMLSVFGGPILAIAGPRVPSTYPFRTGW